ncbi:MAG: HTH domain-containing protein [Bacteroidota bacterium]
MTFKDQLNTLKRIDSLTRRKATGSPDELSRRLNISRASVYRYIGTLKEEFGAPIDYNKNRRSFYYRDEFRLNF